MDTDNFTVNIKNFKISLKTLQLMLKKDLTQ